MQMWEARAAPGCQPELIAWLLARLPPAAQLYRSREGDRVVVLAPEDPPDPPPSLLARPAASWAFDPVARPARQAPSPGVQ
ncbi:MAG: hypothetical protein ACYDB7_03535 [Mycobacteriales bacterium]